MQGVAHHELRECREQLVVVLIGFTVEEDAAVPDLPDDPAVVGREEGEGEIGGEGLLNFICRRCNLMPM